MEYTKKVLNKFFGLMRKDKRHYDFLVLDEFQHISRHASATLKELFCQGRKKGLNVLLSTQTARWLVVMFYYKLNL